MQTQCNFQQHGFILPRNYISIGMYIFVIIYTLIWIKIFESKVLWNMYLHNTAIVITVPSHYWYWIQNHNSLKYSFKVNIFMLLIMFVSFENFKKRIKYPLIFMLMIVETVTVVTYATCTFNMTIVNVQSTAYVKKKKLKTIQTINFN